MNGEQVQFDLAFASKHVNESSVCYSVEIVDECIDEFSNECMSSNDVMELESILNHLCANESSADALLESLNVEKGTYCYSLMRQIYDDDMLEIEGEDAMRTMVRLHELCDETENIDNQLAVSSSSEHTLLCDKLEPVTDIGIVGFDVEDAVTRVQYTKELQRDGEKMKPSVEEAPKCELKPLSPHLKYVFLEKEETLPVIVTLALEDE